MKKALLFCCVLFAARPAGAEVRSIFSAAFHRYSTGTNGSVWEETVLVPANKKTTLLCRGYSDERDAWSNRIFTAGVVHSLTGNSYGEASYGYGKDSGGVRADYYSAEVTREASGLTTGLGYKYTSFQDHSFHTISPSARYELTERASVFGKVFLSRDLEGEMNYSCWAEGEYAVSRLLRFKAGFTAGDRLLAQEFGKIAEGRFTSWLGGFTVSLNKASLLRYGYEALDRAELYDDEIHTLVLDMKF